MARLQRPSRQRSSATDSNFRCGKKEWFRLQTAAMPELQRFLISGGQFGNRCKKTLKNGPTAAVILDFRARLANRCKVLPGNAIFRALILDFRPRIGNRCSTIVVAVEKGSPAAPSSRQFGTACLQHHRCGAREWPACSTIVETVMNGLCGCGRGMAATKAA